MKSATRRFLMYLLIAMITIISAEAIFWSKGYSFINEQSDEHCIEEAQLLHDIYIEGNLDAGEFAKDYGTKYNVRITIINNDGTVIADSKQDPSAMENHSDRIEFQKALSGQTYTTRRRSFTLGMNYSYTAVPLKTDSFNGVLRVSVPLDDIADLNAELAHQVILGLCICFLLVVAISAWLSKKDAHRDPIISDPAAVDITPAEIVPFTNISTKKSGIIQIDDLIINIPDHTVMINRVPIELSKKEFALLETLASNRGRVFSREVLLEQLWGFDYYGETRTVDVHIGNLRKKIEKSPDKPEYILTVRGYGYKFK